MIVIPLDEIYLVARNIESITKATNVHGTTMFSFTVFTVSNKSHKFTFNNEDSAKQAIANIVSGINNEK